MIRALVFASFLVASASALCCEDDQQECVDWITSTSSCQPLDAGPSPNDPYVMCPYHCPPECNEQELVCPSGQDQNGCQHPDMCVSSTIPGLNGEECPNECPTTEMECAPEDQVCDGGYDEGGCPLPKMCMPRSVPSTVDPVVDCWVGCDPHCSGEDMELCDMGMNEQGCPNPKECHYTKNNGWDAVAQTNVECAFECPMPCGADEMRCGTTDQNSCPSAGVCVLREFDAPNPGPNGDKCYGQCEPQCGQDHELCDGGIDENGCPRPMECRYAKHGYWDQATMSMAECGFSCPVVCAAEEMRCEERDENGCPMPGTCVPMGEPCP